MHMLSVGSTFIERIEGVEEATTPKTNDIIVNPQRHHFKPIFYQVDIR